MTVVPSADPEAELARLRRPTGPWLHLLDAAPADARQLGWMLSRDGTVVRILRGPCGRSTYGFLDEVGAALQLPGDPAEDWPALAALLTDMGWLPGAGHVLVVTRASLLLAAEPPGELGELVAAVREVARGRAEEGDPLPFHLVLQDDTVGTAVLRRRLDAVGARYAELAGWDAEEPVAGVTVGGRSALTVGDPEPDGVDRAAAAAVSEVDDVRSLGRAWEGFHGGTGSVRVYAPVLADRRRAAPVAALIAGAVAEAGASCIVVPVPAEVVARDPRQAAVAAAATVIWPAPEAPRTPGTGAGSAGTQSVTGAGPGDGGRDFELVAANLQWDFDPGNPEPDSVDAAVVAHAGAAGRTARLHRSWVKDPGDGWVRVIVAYVGPVGSIAEVEAERAALVDTLQHAGAARCCVEVLAESDAGDAHRWLDERSHRLYRSPARTATGTPTTPAPSPARMAMPTRPASPPPAAPSPAPPSPARMAMPTRPAAPPPAAPSPAAPRPAPAAPPADVPLAAGPDGTDPRIMPLLTWAADQPAVVALVTAWTAHRGAPDRTLVLGVAVDAAAETDPIRATVQQHAPEARIEVFAPARRLSPLQLRLTRSGTRVWQRRTDRPAATSPPRPSLSRPDPPRVVTPGPAPAGEPGEPCGDVRLDGLTLVGIDRRTPVAKGETQPDERDTAVIAWAEAEPQAIALLRAVATVADETIPVYCACVTAEADPEVVRRRLARTIAATGTTRAAAEAFAPAATISAFHLDLAVGSTRLWPVRS